jgi:hypothetical protein
MKRTREQFMEEYNEKRWHFDGTYEERREQEKQMFKDWYDEMEVGDHCHIAHWSDVSPCTIINRTKTTITVRYDKATLKDTWKPEFVLGGFCAHCLNNEDQDDAWDIEEDENGHTDVFRWSKKFNCYKNKCDEKLFPGWLKKYDYNF